MPRSDELTVSRPGYTWGVLWELIRIHRLDSNQGITPRACRKLIGTNAKVGPNVKTILQEIRFEESPVPDLGKAERDAQVRVFWLHSAFPGLTGVSLHGNTSILRSHYTVAPLLVFWSTVAGWNLL